jgi:hypothetical protein
MDGRQLPLKSAASITRVEHRQQQVEQRESWIILPNHRIGSEAEK